MFPIMTTSSTTTTMLYYDLYLYIYYTLDKAFMHGPSQLTQPQQGTHEG